MADTLPDIKIPAKTKVNIYAETGIIPGTQISVHNNSGSDVRLYSGASEPDFSTSGSTLLKSGLSAVNESGDTGAWVWCSVAATINVKVVI